MCLREVQNNLNNQKKFKTIQVIEVHQGLKYRVKYQVKKYLNIHIIKAKLSLLYHNQKLQNQPIEKNPYLKIRGKK